jgi:2-keto-4-pentenoate hydratase
MRIDRGERQIGWKLGYTSVAMRQQMGVDAPNYGPLTDVMRVDTGADLFVDGVRVAEATGAAADGDPCRGVRWLGVQLAKRGLALRAGDVVLSGGLTGAFVLDAGSTISAVFAGQCEVRVSRKAP